VVIKQPILGPTPSLAHLQVKEIKLQSFFYDAQIRRFLLQFTRIFSNFQVEYGRTDSNEAALIRVPVRYGDWSRQAQTVSQDNSASNMPSAPVMTFYITALQYDRPRIQDPYFVSKSQVRQRYYDTNTNTYETTQGNAFSIERLMPVPYRMTINLDIWTSNTNQKWQLVEQITPLFNPSLEIQSTDNYLDWTSLSVVELEDLNYSSRTIPQGTENSIDIATMRFSLPIWISSPARVKKLGVVEKIIASVFDASGDANEAVVNSDLLLGTRQQFTPWMYQVLLIGNRLQILKQSAVVDEPNTSTELPDSPNSAVLWTAVIGSYGAFRPGISQIRLNSQWDPELDIIGTVSYDPTDERYLLFDVDSDTVPQNTLPPVDAVIDPLLSGPGAGLAVPSTGQRYLLLNDIGNNNNTDPASAWGNLVASSNDIIEFNGVQWTVTFNSQDSTNAQYLTNITTGLQYLWTGEIWVKSYEGLYVAGSWSIVL
jgi:hypothetical protein